MDTHPRLARVLVLLFLALAWALSLVGEIPNVLAQDGPGASGPPPNLEDAAIERLRKDFSIAKAKDQPPAVVHQAERGGCVELTRRGKPVAVIISTCAPGL